MKGQISSWVPSHRIQTQSSDSPDFSQLVHRKGVTDLPKSIKKALFLELMVRATDMSNEYRCDDLNALFVCYSQGTLVDANPQQAWSFLWQAARAGSLYGQGQIMYYILATGDFQSATEQERREWSLALLLLKSQTGRKLLMQAPVSDCEKGLRAAVFDDSITRARRTKRRDYNPPLEEIVQDRIEPAMIPAISPLVPQILDDISRQFFEHFKQTLEANLQDASIRNLVLLALFDYAVLKGLKQFMYFLNSRCHVDPLAVSLRTGHNALTLALFEDRNDAVTWMLDMGCDRKLFGSQHIFARLVCNTHWTMANTFIQVCWTYYRDEGLKRLLNDTAPPVQGRAIPPPLILSILANNCSTFAALLRHNVDINIRWGIWTPLLLSVACGMPHITAQLIEQGASITDCTADDFAMTAAHVLADANIPKKANEDQLLIDLFDREPFDRSESPLSASQALRSSDRLLFEILKLAGAPMDSPDKTGRTPVEVAISTGKLWIADAILNESTLKHKMKSYDIKNLRDMDGRNLLSYCIEDIDHQRAQALLDEGYRMDGTDVFGKTVLHEAAEHGNLESVLFCLHNVADSQMQDEFGRTSLVSAISGRNPEVCKAIVSHGGSNVFLKQTKAKENFLHSVFKSQHRGFAPTLLELYEKFRNEHRLPDLAEHIAVVDLSARTPVHDACLLRSSALDEATIPMLTTMLQICPNVASAPDCVGDTPLHDAADNSNPQEHSIRCTEALLAAGANINAQNRVGDTPLHNAWKRRGENQRLIDFMIQKGADTSIRNNLGFTAEGLAQEVSNSTAAAVEADQAYKTLYAERSRWRDIHWDIQRRLSDNRARFASQRAALVLHDALGTRGSRG
jgi:ankyrin repeat protein